MQIKLFSIKIINFNKTKFLRLFYLTVIYFLQLLTFATLQIGLFKIVIVIVQQSTRLHSLKLDYNLIKTVQFVRK